MGETPLHVAVGHNANPAVMTTLLEAGAALEAQAQGGWSLHPDPLDFEYGWTPLHVAAGSWKSGGSERVAEGRGDARSTD